MIHHLLVWIERGTHVRETDTNCFPTWKQREADTKLEKKMAGQSVSLRTNINMDEGSISIGKHTKFWVLVSTHSVEISWFSLDGHQRFFFRIQNAESRLLNSISSHDHGLLFWVFPFLFWLIFNQILRQQQLRVSCVVFLFLYFFPLRLRFREVNHLIKGCGGQVLNKRETSPSKPTTDTFAFFFFFRKLFQRERATNQQMSFLSFFFQKIFFKIYYSLSSRLVTPKGPRRGVFFYLGGCPRAAKKKRGLAVNTTRGSITTTTTLTTTTTIWRRRRRLTTSAHTLSIGKTPPLEVLDHYNQQGLEGGSISGKTTARIIYTGTAETHYESCGLAWRRHHHHFASLSHLFFYISLLFLSALSLFL